MNDNKVIPVNITDVKQDGDWICYKTDSVRSAMTLRYSFQPGTYDLLVKHEEKRSRNANSYAWELIQKISRKMGMNPVEIYKNEISHIPGRTELLWCSSEAYQPFKKSWIGDHLGRDFNIVEDDGNNVTALAVFGSSDYNRTQMSMLIDSLIQDCRALGIETRNPNDIASLLGRWNG